MKKKVYIICGPTASGKSDLAIEQALANNGVIINADSQQVYKDLPILTACPSMVDMEKVSHKLYGFFEGYRRMDAALWLSYVTKEIKEVFAQGKTPYVVGGTGFYIKALTEGLSVIPSVPLNIRIQVRKEGIKAKNEYLYNIVKKYDPDLAARISPSDRQRMLRGIEVYRGTGVPLSAWQRNKKIRPLPEVDFDINIVDYEMPVLEERIKLRTEKMLEMGVVDEVKKLLSLGYDETRAPIFKVIGVATIRKYLNGEYSIDEMKKELVLLTRQYAKRQRTFFRTQLSHDKDKKETKD